MTLRRLLFITVIVALVFTLAGCNLVTDKITSAVTQQTSQPGDDQANPTAEDSSTAQPSGKATTKPNKGETTEPTAVETADSTEQGIDPSSIASLDNLSSYHMVQTGSFTDILTDGTSTTNTINIEVWETKDPAARRVVWTSTKDGEADSTLELITILKDTYMKTADSADWLAMSTSGDELASFGEFGAFTDPTAVMQGDGKLIGVETINGISAKHYLYANALDIGKVIGAAGSIDISQADVWVSEEYNIVVKYESHWKGTDENGVGSEWIYTSEVQQVNEPIVIEAPAGVSKPGLPTDVPLMDGATDVTAFAGVVSFKVTVSAAEVTAFYKSALAENGWQASADPVAEGMASYTKDTRGLTLITSEEEGATTVTILVAEQ